MLSPEDKEVLKTITGSLRKFAFADAFRSLSNWIQNHGWRYTPWQIYEKFEDRQFDWKHGTDTRIHAALSTLEIDSPNKRHGQRYQASPVYSLRRIFKSLKVDYADFSFVDFGSGKGRTLLLASELPFKQVIGVEFSRELHDCASRNISIFRSRQAQHTATVHCDATLFEPPAGNLILYFFNPFNETVLKKVLANICDSIRKYPRPVLIIYLYLDNPELLDGLHGFRLRSQWHRFHIYESIPALMAGNQALPTPDRV